MSLLIGSCICQCTDQFAEPISDISKGDWTASSGTDLYAMLDEVTEEADWPTNADDDTTYVEHTTTASSNDVFECLLANHPGPSWVAISDVRFVLRVKQIGGTSPNLDAALLEGTTTIASINADVTSAFYTDTGHVLTQAEYESITDFSDLRLKIDISGSAVSETLRITTIGFLFTCA